METSPPPHPPIDLSGDLYYQVVYTLTGLLPPPLDATPDGLLARNLAAIAKVAALLPVNANEADLAAQCIAARGQAEDILRLLRQHAPDINLVIRLNAQYGSMVRTSLSVHGRLMRVQALRHKREAIEGAADQDAWTLHVAERSMAGIVDRGSGPPQPAWPSGGVAQMPPAATRATLSEGAPAATRPTLSERAPGTTQPTSSEGAPPATRPTLPKEAPAACEDQKTQQNVSQNGTNSQDTAFETWLSQKLSNLRSRGSSEADLPEYVRNAIARSRAANRSLPANSPESPGTADDGHHIDGKAAST